MHATKLKKAKHGHLMAPPIKITSRHHRESYESPDRISGGLRTPKI